VLKSIPEKTVAGFPQPFMRGALGCVRNRKTEDKIVQNRKTAKKIRPTPKTACTVIADTVVTRGAYKVNYTNTNFIKVFFVFMTP